MVGVQFAYAKLPDCVQRLVHDHLEFRDKRRLRRTTQRFARLPAAAFLIDGRYENIRCRTEPSFPGGIQRDAGMLLFIFNRTPELPSISVSVSLDREGTIDRDFSLAYSETRSVDAPPGEDSYERNITLRMPGGSDAQSRLLDKLTRDVRCREFYPAQAPPQLTALPMFCRGNLAIHPELGPETRLGERYFEMDSWMWPGLKPDQAYLFSRDLRPEEYLDIYLDAFQKLINCPVVRLMQCYENEAECIAALPTIQQLFEAIIQAPRIEREDGRRLVIVDIQRRGQEFHMKGKTRIWDKVEMPELAAKYATMMKGVRAVMDSRQPNDVQLYQADLPSPRIYYTVPRTPTTANLIIAQNYASPWQVYAQILQSNTRDRNETMPPLRRLWPRPTDDAM